MEEKNKNYSKTLITNEIILTSEFETGNGRDFKEYDKDIFGFYPEKDSTDLYSSPAYYFKFKIENRLLKKQDTKKITITAIADDDKRGWEQFIGTKIWKYNLNGSIEQLNPKNTKPTLYSIGINLELKPKEKFFVSNMITIPYSEMKEKILDLCTIYPSNIKIEEIGKSPMGNSIYSLKLHPHENIWNESSKIKILISGSPQPSEFGDFAALNLLKMYLNKGEGFWNELKEYFKFQFIFFQNPDGIVYGKNMTNSKGENIFFSYNLEQNNLPQECEFVWEFIKKEPPDLYLEIHSYSQFKKTIRPYIYPYELLKSDVRKRIYKKLSKELVSFSNGAVEKIKLNEKWFSNTLAYQLQKNFDTLSFQYKLHSNLRLEENWKIIWNVFEKVIKNLRKLKIELRRN